MIGISWRRITKFRKSKKKKLPLCGMTGSQRVFTRKKDAEYIYCIIHDAIIYRCYSSVIIYVGN